MNSEQEKELLDYLASLGFKGEKFTNRLQEMLKLNTPNFSVPDKISYGEERMFFKLYFVKDVQFDAYHLQRYEATHRSPVLPEHQIINGIDTAALEERMKGQDWELYFNRPKDAVDSPAIKDMLETTQLLNKLSEGQNFDGIDIQEELMYKYWPSESYYSNGKSDFKTYHERSREFSAGEYGICNANLAYNILSGRLDDIYEKLQPMNIDQLFNSDLHNQLEHILSKNNDPFVLRFSRNDPEGFKELSVPVLKKDGWYDIETFNATLTPYPPIEHGTYNDIDSKKLEDQMREIDWHDDRRLFIFHEDSAPGLQPGVGDIQEQIFRLSLNMVGSEIADQLMLKYWSDATFFEGVVQQTAWDHLDSLPKKMQDFPADMDVKASFNLLYGRAVKENLVHTFLPESDNWVRLNINNKDANGAYPEVQIKGFSNVELENVLDVFPIPNSYYYQVKNSLLIGDLTPVKLANDRKVLMQASPEQRTVNVYTPDMRYIPTNVHLDPDWKPPLQETQNTSQQADKKIQTHPKYPHPKAIQKGKGKGL